MGKELGHGVGVCISALFGIWRVGHLEGTVHITGVEDMYP